MRIVIGLALLVIGPIIAFAGLIRLGFGRHGTPWYDLSFLSNEMTGAHVQNLLTLATGGVCFVAGVWLVISALLRDRAT